MTQSLIAFGANVGDPHKSLNEAVLRLVEGDAITLLATATPVVTAAVSGKPEVDRDSRSPDYLNSVLLVETELSARQLFAVTARIEQEMGRQRKHRWGPRAIDLDILLYGQQRIADQNLEIPHPRMSFRKFVIEPAAEIAPEFIDPVSGVQLKQLWRRLSEAPQKIAWIAGDKKLAEATLGCLECLGWEGEIVDSPSQLATSLEEFRLIAFAAPESDFLSSAKAFAGPWLNLTGLPQGQWEREILGAVQAMA